MQSMLINQSDQSRDNWIKRIFLTYTVLFLIGMTFYAGSRLHDFVLDPVSTASAILISGAGAFLVGVLFGLLGVMCAFTTFMINDNLQHR